MADLRFDAFKKINLDEIWQFNGDAYHLAYFGWQRGDESLRPDDMIAYGYIAGFKWAADLLIDCGACPDAEVFPIVFCYRQYLELLLKHFYQTALGDDDVYMDELRRIGHDLHKLWKKAKPFLKDHLKTIGLEKETRKEFVLFFAEVIDKFMDMDATSFNFRYPKDKQLNDSIQEDALYIDLPKLKQTLQAIDNVMFGSYGL